MAWLRVAGLSSFEKVWGKIDKTMKKELGLLRFEKSEKIRKRQKFSLFSISSLIHRAQDTNYNIDIEFVVCRIICKSV